MGLFSFFKLQHPLVAKMRREQREKKAAEKAIRRENRRKAKTARKVQAPPPGESARQCLLRRSKEYAKALNETPDTLAELQNQVRGYSNSNFTTINFGDFEVNIIIDNVALMSEHEFEYGRYNRDDYRNTYLYNDDYDDNHGWVNIVMAQCSQGKKNKRYGGGTSAVVMLKDEELHRKVIDALERM